MPDTNAIDITVDGKTESLKLTYGEVEEIEDAFDRPIGEIDLNRSKAMRLLIEFALRRRNPGVNRDVIRRQLQDEDFEKVMERLKEPEPEVVPPTKGKAAAKAA